jgi:hypothetical protein
MNTRSLLFTIAMLVSGITAFCQAPPKEFFDGLDNININQAEAKKDFSIAVTKAPQFHGSYHFLGVICLNEKKPDSAIWYFTKSIALNEGNINHTKEMTYVRLISTYTEQQDFADSFKTGLDAYHAYPDSRGISSALKDACLWSYYIKHNELDPSYLSADIKPEYVVNNIDEEYLIVRNLRVDDDYLSVNSQALVNKKNASYDVLKCIVSRSKKEVEVDFKINWDMGKYFGGKPGPTQEVISDNKAPAYERVGAALVSSLNPDLKTAIETVIH